MAQLQSSSVTGSLIVSGALEVLGAFSGSIVSALTASYVNPLEQDVEVTGSLNLTSGINAGGTIITDSEASFRTNGITNNTYSKLGIFNFSGWQSGTQTAYFNGWNQQSYINSPLNIGIASTTMPARLRVRGSGASSSTTALRIENSNASASLLVDDAGDVYVPSGSIYGDTTNPFVQLTNVGGAVLGYGTSTLVNGGSLQFVSAGTIRFRVGSNGLTGINTATFNNSVGFAVNEQYSSFENSSNHITIKPGTGVYYNSDFNFVSQDFANRGSTSGDAIRATISAGGNISGSRFRAFSNDTSGNINAAFDSLFANTENETSFRSRMQAFNTNPIRNNYHFQATSGSTDTNVFYVKDTGKTFIKEDLTVGNGLVVTGSLNVLGDINHDGDLTVTGVVTAQEFKTEFVSASIVYRSGSTKFGDTDDDVHSFTGSLEVTGSVTVFDGNQINFKSANNTYTGYIKKNSYNGEIELGNSVAIGAYSSFRLKGANNHDRWIFGSVVSDQTINHLYTSDQYRDSSIYAGDLGFFGFYSYGATNPANVMGLFDRSGNDNHGVKLLYQSASVYSEGLVIDNEGKVGIGTTTPNADLHLEAVEGSTASSFLITTGSERILDVNSHRSATWAIDPANTVALGSSEGNSTGIYFHPSGSLMFIIGYAYDGVQGFDLSTPWDLTTATPNTDQFFIGGTVQDIYFKPDGTEMFVVDDSPNQINRYTLNQPWSASTATFSQSLNVGHIETSPTSVEFKPDGTEVYLAGRATDSVYQWSLSTPWDLNTTGSLVSKSVASLGFSAPESLRFNADGTLMHLIGYTQDAVGGFELSTPWDLSTAVYRDISPNFRLYEPTPTGLYYNEDLQKAFITGRSADRVYGLVIDKSLNVAETISANVLHSRKYITAEQGMFVGGSSIFGSGVTMDSSLYHNSSTARLINTSGGEFRIGGSISGTLTAHFGYRNYYSQTGGTTLNFINNVYGGKGTINIGKAILSDHGLGDGIVNIDSDADTFDQKGDLTIGRTLRVEGSQELRLKEDSTYLLGTVAVYDSFTEASDTSLDSHTADTGSGYTLEYSTAGITVDDIPVIYSGGYLSPARSNTNDGILYTSDTLPSIADYEVRTTIRQQRSGDDMIWLVIRYVDSSNFYAVSFSNSTSYCFIYKRVNGVSTQLRTLTYYVNPSAADNADIEVAVRMVGNKLTVFYEGDFRGFVIDDDISSAGKGGFGFGAILPDAWTSADIHTDMKLSNFQITELPPSVFAADNIDHYIHSGSLGIGTTTPSYRLDVSGSGRFNNTVYISGSDTLSATEAFKVVNSAGDIGIQVLNNGNVGIGGLAQTSSTYGLRVYGALWADDISQLDALNGSSGVGTIRFYDRGSTLNMELYGPHGSEAVKGIMQLTTAGKNHQSLSTSILHADPDFLDNPSFVIRSLNSSAESYAMMNYKSGSGFMLKTSEPAGTGTADMTFKPSGSEVLFLSSSGNVGIGTTTPAHLLDVSGSAHIDENLHIGNPNTLTLKQSTSALEVFASNQYQLSLKFAGNNNYLQLGAFSANYGSISYKGQNNLYLGANGQVGVGVLPTTTSQRFLVSGSANQWGVVSLRGMTDALSPTSYYYGAGNAHNFTLPIVVSNNINIFDGASAISESGYRIGNNDGVLNVGHVKAGTTVDSTVFNISGSSVGIGTTTPSTDLEIGDGLGTHNVRIYAQTSIFKANTSGTGEAALYLADNDREWRIQKKNNGNNLTIRDNTQGSDVMTFEAATGNVGIGTTSPSQTLDVSGSVIFRPSGTSDTISLLSLGSSQSRLLTTNNFAIWSGGSEAIRFLTNGNIGIGTSTPAEKLTVEGNISGSGNLTVAGAIEGASKSFNIPHPTQPGKKLIYGSLEGPEHGVYARGQVEGNVIELPEEWTGLVDDTTITVQLTSIGSHQNLYVADIKDNKVFIKNGNTFSSKIKAFYFIQAMRKDIDKLQTIR